jgi:hypothetical protein
MRDIAQTYDLPIWVIEMIINSQFEFVANVIKNCDRTNPSTFKNINLQYFGKFAVKEARKKYYEKLKNDRTESDD